MFIKVTFKITAHECFPPHSLYSLLDSRICESGENLSHLTTFLPSKNSRKSVRVNLSDLRKLYDFTHIIVIIPKSLVEVRVNVDVYSVSERHLSLQAPRWITYFLKKQVTYI